MNIHEMLCKEFCGTLSVREVPCGFAIGTGYSNEDGDALGFYVVRDGHGRFRIEDNGLSIPLIEAQGVDLAAKARLEAFNDLLEEYGVLFNEDDGELTTEPLAENQIASAAMRFLAFLLRVQDLILLTRERVASTFREDAMSILVEQLKDRAKLSTDAVVHEELKEYPADVLIEAPARRPVALYFGTSDARVYESLLLQSYAENKNIDCSVVTLLETTKGVSQKLQIRANNHLDAVPVFRGSEMEAIGRIVKEATGERLTH